MRAMKNKTCPVAWDFTTAMPGMACAYFLFMSMSVIRFLFRVCPIFVHAVPAWIVWHMLEGYGLLAWDRFR